MRHTSIARDWVFKVHKSAYPGKKRLRTIAIAGCENRVTTNHFCMDWPTKAEWNDGFKWVRCYDKTNG